MKVVAPALLACLAAGVVATGYVVVVAPHACAWIAALALAAALLVCRGVDEYGWLLPILWAAFALLGNGLYAAHLLGAGEDAVFAIAAALAVMVVAVLGAALVRAGAADPYDD